jgi:hypothetical protein
VGEQNSSTPRKQGATRSNARHKRATIKQRAHAIFNDARRYDRDTRAAVVNALIFNDADLAECITRAERGETILDISKKRESDGATNQQLNFATIAMHLEAILQNPETPATLYNIISDEITNWSSAYCSAVCDTAPYIESCLTFYHVNEAKSQKGESA